MFIKGNPKHWTKLSSIEETKKKLSLSLSVPRPDRKNGKNLKCAYCGESFYVPKKRENTARFCSRFCTDGSRKGIMPSQLIKFAGKTAGWNRGKKRDWESPSEFQVGDNINEGHWKWKGSNASYNAIHSWISRKLGKPRICEVCGTKTAHRYEWADKNGAKSCSRKLNDYIRLCKPCHTKFDKEMIIQKEVRRRLKNLGIKSD